MDVEQNISLPMEIDLYVFLLFVRTDFLIKYIVILIFIYIQYVLSYL